MYVCHTHVMGTHFSYGDKTQIQVNVRIRSAVVNKEAK